MGSLFYSRNTIIYSGLIGKMRLAGIVTKKYSLKSLIYYPNVDFPPLGLEILRFTHSSLVILDIHPNNPLIYAELIDQLGEIKRQYSELDNVPRVGFYNPERFFTRSILYGRVSDEWVSNKLPNLLTAYLSIYVSWLHRAGGNADHSEFKQYCRTKDPACKLIKNVMGAEEGQRFIDTQLFP